MGSRMMQRRLCQLGVLIGLGIHVVGAIAALPILADTPDFAAYCVAGWGARSGLEVYDWPATVEAAIEAGIPMAAAVTSLPVDYPPSWLYLMIPFSWLPYNVA
jgi:hypothetical protein